MKWARGTTPNGRMLTGVIEGETFHPRAGLGSDESAGEVVLAADMVWAEPCVPGKFMALWNNFHAAAEKNGLEIPEHPLHFLKAPTSLAGPGAEVVIPDGIGRVIFEGELGIVIGKICKGVCETEAEDAILGYTCVNDFTALNVLFADPSFPQWTRAKGYDGFGVIGPVIETDVDWKSLEIKVLVGGRERQSYQASDMIMPPAKIVSLLSQDMTLEAGDVIACGTSLGARPVKVGDVVEVVIEGIGTLGVTMAAPRATDGVSG